MRALLAIPLRLLGLRRQGAGRDHPPAGAIVSLILGPFLIMLVFGLGSTGPGARSRPSSSSRRSTQLPTDAASYQQLAGGGLHIASVTADQAAAEAQLRSGTLDVVIVVPDDAEAQFRAGKQSTIQVQVNAVDPVQVNYAGFLASLLSSAVNREIITRVAAEGQDYAVAAGEAEAAQIPPEVVAARPRPRWSTWPPSQPGSSRTSPRRSSRSSSSTSPSRSSPCRSSASARAA
jgi:ABC-2 type transport system permease protein